MIPMRVFCLAMSSWLCVAPDAVAQLTACPTSSDALSNVAHDFWAAYNRRDLAALDSVLDDQLLFVSVQGAAATKADFLAAFRAPEGSIKSESAERMEDLRTVAAGNTAVVSFKRRWTLAFKSVAITDTAYSRMTETLICRGGRWRIIAFQETFLPNAARSPNTAAASRYDDYVGRYRFGANGDGGEITVTRNGEKLFEAWGKDPPIELLPGKHDTFFTRGFPWVERFVRDKRGRVVGIHYTLEDGEMEAKRTMNPRNKPE
jgi:ketosteroid isomerase-like protein